MKLLSVCLLALLFSTSAAAWAPVAGPERADRTLVVAGASGRTGRHVVAQALEAGFDVRALTRDPERAAATIDPHYPWVRADVRDADALRETMRGAEFVITAIGATEWSGPNSPEFVDYGGVVKLVDAAVEARVRHFVLISSARAGTHIDHATNPRMGYVLKWKTLGEAHLKAIIGPGGLVAGTAGTAGIRLTTREQYVRGLIARADVARIAIAALTLPAAVGRSFAIVNDPDLASDAWLEALRALPPERPR
jgi:uncharacterized protein YbjT (DUF2867 family)